MKISSLHLTLIWFFSAVAFTAKAHLPTKTLGDTIIIQFRTGYGIDCIGYGRQCLATQPMIIGEQVAPAFHGVAKAWFDEQGRFVMEVRQLFNTNLYNELEGGTFYLDASVPLSDLVMTGLGRDGQSFTLPPGVHAVRKQQDGSYRIVF